MNKSLDFSEMFPGYNRNAMWQMLSSDTESNSKNVTCLNTDFCTPSPHENTEGVLAMAFVNMQPLESVYTPAEALCKGTLFPNIDKPFYGGMKR